MLPILFKIGSVTIHTYGVAIAVAFLFSIFLIRSEAKRKGFYPDLAYDIVLFAMIGGIIGARLVYVVDHWRDFAVNPAQVFAIWQGGLVFYGGLIGGALAVLIFVRQRRLSIGRVADMVAPSLAFGSAIGRLGCFANGCCYGKETSLPWGVTFTNSESSARPLGIPLHPTQLYEFTYNLIILGILLWARSRIKSDGLLFWIYISMYGFSRFIVEFFRTNPTFALGMSASQIFSIIMLVTGLTVIFGYYFRSNRVETEQANN
ncbi:MAG: prolipoprotein diacylglyceryl transferase [Firmicutes bacterium]|nr:prolipoprotein diacylglyceryl transferase [Bacillota bacterium]